MRSWLNYIGCLFIHSDKKRVCCCESRMLANTETGNRMNVIMQYKMNPTQYSLYAKHSQLAKSLNNALYQLLFFFKSPTLAALAFHVQECGCHLLRGVAYDRLKKHKSEVTQIYSILLHIIISFNIRNIKLTRQASFDQPAFSQIVSHQQHQ